MNRPPGYRRIRSGGGGGREDEPGGRRETMKGPHEESPRARAGRRQRLEGTLIVTPWTPLTSALCS